MKLQIGFSMALLSWGTTLLLGLSAYWSTFNKTTSTPLAGLKALIEQPVLAWILFILMAGISGRLSFFPITKQSMQYISGFLFGCWLILALTVGTGPFMGIAFLSTALYVQASKKLES